MKFFTKEVRIALVAIVGIVILFFGLNFLKGMSVFSNDNVYYIKFKNISGLSASNPIYADGYQVGVVKDINYDYQNSGNVIVEFTVDHDLRIPKGSSAVIESDLMGNVKMNLLLANNPRQRVEPGDTLSGTLSEGMMGAVTRMVPVLEQTVSKVDSLLDNLNRITGDPAIVASLHNVQTITGDLTVSTRELNRLLSQTNRALPQMVGKANGVLDNTNRLTANLADVDVAGTMAKVDQTLANELTDSSEVVGTNLEGIAVRKGHVYVSNGWNNDYTYNTNVVKLQAATLDKEKDIAVVTNPGALLNTSDGLYLLSVGDYYSVPGQLQKIDDQDQVSVIGNYTMMAADENGLYLVNAPYGSPATYSYYSFATKTAVKWIDGTEIFNPYAIGVDSVSGKVYVTSLSKDENTGYASYVMDGYIVAYTTAGVKTGQWTVGVCPGVIVPLYSE